MFVYRSDWLLKFVYRAASVQVGDIAGLGPIEVDWPRLVNIDLTEKVSSVFLCCDIIIEHTNIFFYFLYVSLHRKGKMIDFLTILR